MTTITGRDAIEYARQRGLTLNKYADPTELDRSGLTVDEAEEIAREDASLIWVSEIEGEALDCDGILVCLSDLGATGSAKIQDGGLYTRREENCGWLYCGPIADKDEAREVLEAHFA